MAGTSTAGDHDYYKSWSPTWSTLQSGLAIFAAIVILRSCARYVHSFLIQPRRLDLNAPTSQRDFNLRHLRNPLSFRRAQPQQQHHLPQHYWDMEEKDSSNSSSNNNNNSSGGARGTGSGLRPHHPVLRGQDMDTIMGKPLALNPRWSAENNHGTRHVISRPPPAPPLTPPELSSTIFTLEARPQSQDSFIHQPNPDYASASTPSSASQPSTVGTISYPQRLSYSKTVPIGIPVTRKSSKSEVDLVLPSNSYPPTSPLLPPPPPEEPQVRGDESLEEDRIGVQGEIVSVLDQEGAGWTRHTRVYGGGVCLACAAAGREHGEGGFYGDTVSPEERR